MGAPYGILGVCLGVAVLEGYPGAFTRALLPMLAAYNLSLKPSRLGWLLLALGNLGLIMPEMNGRELAIEMRRIRPQAPIIMLSGAVDVPGEALKVVDAFVPKDCLASRLLPAIALLRGSELLPLSSYDA
jgi:DNA-binding NarL/FixJ family response regulator